MPKINIPQKPRIIAIVGPTSSGKSDLAIKLALKFKGEIVSADSRQVYRGMDIGTGKVSKKEQRLVPHYLIDVAGPKKIFNVSQFQKLASKKIGNIIQRNKLPIIVGGTGQYIDTLIYNFNLPEVPPNYKLRAKLEKQTTKQLFSKLKKLDPERAKKIDSKNPRRLIRAIEIITYTGEPIGKLRPESPYKVLWLGLNPKDLNKRISKRLDARFAQGMITEVKTLQKNGVSYQRLYDLGLEYRFIGQMLQKKITPKEMRTNLEIASIQYSKRQMTWFKRNKEIHWVKNLKEAMQPLHAFLRKA
ncbi:MAG: tRNA (adenosine(37)-N6)-dimethylallyltransferase MiaA [Patescibacteria group bacterium]